MSMKKFAVSGLVAVACAVGVTLSLERASADVGDPCDVQAGALGATLHIRADLLLTTVMLENTELGAFECATRTSTPPDTGNWVTAPLQLVGWLKVASGGTAMTFYETDIPVVIGGIDTGDTYWVASSEVTLDEP